MVALEYSALEAPQDARKRPLKVGVLVDLELGVEAGGHVKCWERLARAACAFPDILDLTLHFAGAERRIEFLGENVRYVVEPPVFSTARLRFLSHVPDHTDLAPWHPRLARALRGYDVIHTTDAFFAYARTAVRVARSAGIPLVTSVHTNTPKYGGIYTGATIERVFGSGLLRHVLIDRLGLGRRVERRMQLRLEAHQRQCAFTFVSRPEQLDVTRAALGGRAGLLRRGIDRALFAPARRDRGWLNETLGIPANDFVVLFVGRVTRGKNVTLLAEAVAALAERGMPIRLVCAGKGNLRDDIRARLGDAARCPGALLPATLARLYASADIFALPSQIEESANVVPEALASGLPALVAAESGMGRIVIDGETGCVLPGDSIGSWAEAIRRLAQDPERRARMGVAARRYAESRLPSWQDVLTEDLLPHWRAAAAGKLQ
ncbi:MAG TPA: glycosyltransferase [Alphaproteobacteria bacterium]|nr:glycosyltransferase [Alphaproteobacteria bacterium]